VSYRGRYQLGKFLPLAVRCLDGNGSPVEPDTAPVAMLVGPSGPLDSVRLGIKDRFQLTGYFQTSQRLDSRFSAGNWQVVYNWTVGGLPFTSRDDLEIVPGGHPDGAGLSLFYVPRPQADYLLLACDSGRIIRRRNPR
jgi:hypothetical protein